jgi:hypothetical protein
MKSINQLFKLSVIITAIVLLQGCKKTTEDEFKEANGDIKEKYLSSIEVISDEFEHTELIHIGYDNANRVIAIQYGNEVHDLIYDDNNLSYLTIENELQDLENLYLAPHDIIISTSWSRSIRTGNVLEYDSKLNPSKVEIFSDKRGYLYGTGYYTISTDTLMCDILYDPNPNPIFYTLKAAGFINVLDRVDLVFGVQSPKIIQARQLLPYNNIKSLTFRDKKGLPVTTIKINSTYDTDSYPDFSTILVLDQGFSQVHKVYYYYN